MTSRRTSRQASLSKTFLSKTLLGTTSLSEASVHRISGPAELVQAVPYLLGFHPQRSVVLVGLDRGTLVVTARLDLPEADADARGDFLEIVVDTVGTLRRGGADELVAAVYAGSAPAHLDAVLDLLDGAAVLHDVTLLDTLLVTEHGWRSLLCADPECCVGESPLPEATSSFVAAATVAGVAPLAARSDLEATLDRLPADVRAELEPVVAEAENVAVQAALDGGRSRHVRSVVRALFAAARASESPEWSLPDDVQVARFGAALAETGIRDSVWMGVDDGRIDGRPLWRDLARRLPEPYDAAALFLYGWASWRAGDGALASIAVERALESDPGYTAADLLGAALSRGVDPRRLPRLRLPRSA